MAKGKTSGFQTPCECLTLDGNIDCAVVVDPGCCPSNIVKADKTFEIAVSFDIEGSVVPLMAGKFEVKVRVEAIGPGPEFTTKAVVLDVVADKDTTLPPPVSTANHRFYSTKVAINNTDSNGNLIGPGLPDGSYFMLAVIRYIDTNGNPGTMAGLSNQMIIDVAKDIS